MIILHEEFDYVKKKTKKTQIVLCDTLRPHNFYINSLKYRYRNNKIPHYIINKRGEIFSLFPTEYYSNILTSKAAIVICLENLGWLQKSSLAPMYMNWIGDVYRGEPHCARWKERFFWDVYTDEQIRSLSELINELSEKHDIPKVMIDTTAPIRGFNKFKGIISRCNISNVYTDIGPAFNINYFKTLLNEEEAK